MAYFGQFDRFDPLTGHVPNSPFGLLPQIAQRARDFLKYRTTEQISQVADAIDFLIFSHFAELKENEIHRLREIVNEPKRWKRDSQDVEDTYVHAMRFFEWDGGSETNGRWLFKEDMEDELGIPTVWNSSEVEVLKEYESYWNDLGGEGFSNPQPCEVFAVLSLWMLADAISRVEKVDEAGEQMDQAFDRLIKSLGNKKPYIPSAASIAGEYALKAMDAVCYAEHLLIVGAWKATHEQVLEKQKDDKNRKTLIVEKMNIARHQKRNEAMGIVVTEWEKETSKFQSAEKAGNYFSNWLADIGFEYEPRTVTSWIRDHAKKIGVRFR